MVPLLQHGLHLPHVKPGDDIKVQVGPQQNFSYAWNVVQHHSPGTYWYHPHVHGSTSLQVGGGALGMLVIEENATSDEVPQWLLSTAHEEVRLVIQVMAQRMLADIEAQSGATPLVTNNTGPSNLILVNGQIRPVVSMAMGRWYRWRIVFSSLHHRTQLATPGCEFGILAKDGIFVRDAPRPLDYMNFAAGNRVDILIRCSADAELLVVKPLEWPRGPSCRGNAKCHNATWDPSDNTMVRGGEVTWLENQTIATIRVSATNEHSGTLSDLGKVDFAYPDYLEDLREHETNGFHDLIIMTDDPVGGAYMDDDDLHKRTNGLNGCAINGDVFRGEGKDNLFDVYTHTAEEYRVQASFHPLHVHGTTHLQSSSSLASQ